MNYYEHHIGDYAEATSHLSFIEDAAYARCIRKYYSSEQPLPADVKAVQRLVGARTRDERRAVETVLFEFFTLEADGWHNRRCDEELERFSVKRQNAKASANARWHGHADGKQSDMRKASDRNANASSSHDVRNALQAPSAKHQTPGTKLSESDSDTGTSQNPHTPARTQASYARACVREEVGDATGEDAEGSQMLFSAGLDRKRADPYLEAWASEGYGTERLLAAIGIAIGRKRTDTVPAKYVDQVVRDEGNFPKTKRSNGNGSTNGNGKHHDTATELEDRAIEDAIRRGLSDAEIVRLPDLQLAPELHTRIEAKRREVSSAKH